MWTLTPLCEFVGKFLVDSAEYQDDDQVDDGRSDASDGRSLRSEDSFSAAVQRNRDDGSVEYRSDDAYQHDTRLHTEE